MHRPAEYQPPPTNPLPLAGWALIAGSVIYTVYVMAPPRFMDARWEFDAMGLLANNSLLPLLGIALVLHGRQPVVGLQRLVAYRLLLAACLVMAALSLFMIPLAAGDERTLISAANGEMAGAEAAQAERNRKVGNLIDGAKTIQDLAAMGAMLSLAPTPEERRLLHLDDHFDAFKTWTQRRVQTALDEQRARAFEQYHQRITGLQKDLARIIAVNLLIASCYLVLAIGNWGLFRPHVPNEPTRM